MRARQSLSPIQKYHRQVLKESVLNLMRGLKSPQDTDFRSTCNRLSTMTFGCVVLLVPVLRGLARTRLIRDALSALPGKILSLQVRCLPESIPRRPIRKLELCLLCCWFSCWRPP